MLHCDVVHILRHCPRGNLRADLYFLSMPWLLGRSLPLCHGYPHVIGLQTVSLLRVFALNESYPSLAPKFGGLTKT